MYPELFHVGGFVVTSFGAMVALGALVGLWIFSRELQIAKLPPHAVDAAVYGIIGGFLGAKLLYVFEHLGEEPFASLLFARGGLSWFGGVAGGLATGVATIVARRLSIVAVLAAATPALAIGHAIGRIGCFLVGDDYGSPSSAPWAVAFPRGLPPTDVPVHPTQIYELVLLVPLAWVLMRMRRRGVADRTVLGTYMVAAGAIRFVVEWFRVDRRVALDMSVAHWASLLLILIGIAVLYARRGVTPARARVRAERA
jgi:phosphatidylglycerol:prolipoprotein diacylglycerol transferase